MLNRVFRNGHGRSLEPAPFSIGKAVPGLIQGHRNEKRESEVGEENKRRSLLIIEKYRELSRKLRKLKAAE